MKSAVVSSWTNWPAQVASVVVKSFASIAVATPLSIPTIPIYTVPLTTHEFYYTWEWLAEIYSAYPGDPRRFPDDDAVMAMIPSSERDVIEKAGGPIGYLRRHHGMEIRDMRRIIPPDPYQMVINRRAV